MVRTLRIFILSLFVVFYAFAACSGTTDTPNDAGSKDTISPSDASTNNDTNNSSNDKDTNNDLTDDVVEIAIRRLNKGQDLAKFKAARDAFVAKLKAQSGVGTDREFQAVFDFSTQKAPEPPVYIGMTQYDSLATFQAVGKALGTSAEAGAFFATFKPEVFTALKPLKAGTKVDLAGIADQAGQMLEVAVRDLSQYKSFDQADYEAKRDAFLALLRKQKGFIAEYQWISALDKNIAVGMTVYKDQAAFQAIAADKAFMGSKETTSFLGAYPPKIGFLNVVKK